MRSATGIHAISGRWARRVGALGALAAATVALGSAGGAAASTAPALQTFNTPLGSLTGLDAPGPAPTKGVVQATSGCIAVSSIPVSFTSAIGPNWTTLDIRTHPFQACPVVGAFHTGAAFHVDHYTTLGQKIALHPSLCGNFGSQASSVWYHTNNAGWVWSGGTSNPVWNTSC